MNAKPEVPHRADFAHFTSISTRWSDNDAYRHVNNVVYYGFFDTAVNAQLLQAGALDLEHSPVVGLVVQTQCRYLAPIAFPDRVTVGLRVSRIGRTSVAYALAVFRNDEEQASAVGEFVHVYVERASSRPVEVPAAVRQALAPLARAAQPS